MAERTGRLRRLKAGQPSKGSPAFLDFMLSQWRSPPTSRLRPLAGAARFGQRRAEVAKRFPGELLLIPSGSERIRANDTAFPFRASSDFYYLTGSQEADSVLALVPSGEGHEAVLFLHEATGRSDPSFFLDSQRGALWVGPRPGLEASRVTLGIARCESLKALPGFLKRWRRRPLQGIRGLSGAVDRAVPVSKSKALPRCIAELRLIKDRHEIAAIRRACATTRRGFEDIIRRLPHAASEREIEGVFQLRARMEGNGVGYNVIAAAGSNACILHWNRNDGRLKPGELLLVDAGAETDQLYTADVTRVLPISGHFSPVQRQVYNWVREAQQAAFAAVRPGAAFTSPNRAAMEVLARGLVELGVLKVSASEALDRKRSYYRRYTLHGVSHMLGLDVHDCAKAPPSRYREGTLEPGMVLTIEPGLYFQKDDLTVPPPLRGIGVRIEDDVLVTRRGASILSDLPRDADAVETWIADLWP